MDIHLYGTVKNATIAFHFELADVYLVKLGYYLCHLMEEAKFVESLDSYCDGEKVGTVHLPSGPKDAVAMIGLDFDGYRAL